MHTNAPDRGRDVSVERVIDDSLSGETRERVIVQAKHWLSKSIGVTDVATALAQMALWEPPLVHVLVMATTGRFSADAVAWIERHNNDATRPKVELWPDSHLELVLARMPHLAAGFNLR